MKTRKFQLAALIEYTFLVKDENSHSFYAHIFAVSEDDAKRKLKTLFSFSECKITGIKEIPINSSWILIKEEENDNTKHSSRKNQRK